MLWEKREVEGGGSGADAACKLEVLRAKGVLYVTSDDNKVKRRVVQAVREVYEITPGPDGFDETTEQKMNKVVLIGKGLREEDLLPGLRKTVVTSKIES